LALTLLLIFISQEGNKQHKEQRTTTDKQTTKKEKNTYSYESIQT